MPRTPFRESQQFAVWIFVLLSLVTAPIVYKIVSKQDWGASQMIPLGITLCLFLFFICIRLRTQIDEAGIYVDFKPFVWRKRWSWDKIQQVQVEQYRLSDYGGWGYRMGRKGTALTTKGKWGIQIQFKNGDRILVGTQRPEEIQQAIDNFKHERF